MRKITFNNGGAQYADVIAKFDYGWRIKEGELGVEELPALDVVKFMAAMSEVDPDGFRLTGGERPEVLDEILRDVDRLKMRLRGERN